jgi:hypothetical protein
VRGSHQVALEVQRSKQVLREYQHRQHRYRQQGIRCVWFARFTPAGHRGDPGLPLFVVKDWEASPSAVVVGRVMPVPHVVSALLEGRLKWRESVATTRVTHEVLHLLCPACGTSRDVAVSRWRHGTCQCGLPVVQQEPNPGWWQQGRCCGYWGPALTVSRTTRTKPDQSAVALGHWCLHAPLEEQQVSA